MQKYLDSHCHLPTAEPFADVFARANAVGINGCVLNATNETEWNDIVNISDANKNVVGAIGIHPWYVDNVSPNWVQNMRTILTNHQHILLGEVGLDKTHENFPAQEKIFITCLEMAIEYKRVLNLHCVHAWDVILRILKSYKNQLPKIVIHGFDGTENATCFDENLYFSIGPNINKPNYNKIKLSIGELPKNKILLESDSTNLTPILAVADGVFSVRPDINVDDIFNTSLGVFFNG